MDALEAIFTRRSIRNYLDRPVETEKVQLLLKAAMIAPTTVDNRDWELWCSRSGNGWISCPAV